MGPRAAADEAEPAEPEEAPVPPVDEDDEAKAAPDDDDDDDEAVPNTKHRAHAYKYNTAVRTAYSIRVTGCKELRDAPSTYYLYPGVGLYYEIRVADGATEWCVLRRFSEVRKFWDTLRPTAAAVGAPLEPFPQHSAVMSGAGYTGNLYETNPHSEFANERMAILRAVLADLAAKTDATGGSLLELRAARAFFDLDDAAGVGRVRRPSKTSHGAPPLMTREQQRGPEDRHGGARHHHLARTTTRPLGRNEDGGDGDGDEDDLDDHHFRDTFLSNLTRSTPTAFVTVFVVVLAALYAFS